MMLSLDSVNSMHLLKLMRSSRLVKEPWRNCWTHSTALFSMGTFGSFQIPHLFLQRSPM